MQKALPEPPPLEYAEEVAGLISMRLYEDGDCRAVVEYAKRDGGWAAAPVYKREGADKSATRPEYRSARALALDERSPVGREFEERLNRLVKPLVNKVWRAKLETHKATHLVRYAPGDFYVAHVDTIPGQDHRYFTVLCYLNDDFEGGRTSFPVLGHAVAPRAGTAVVFPSSYLHCAEPVTRGEKFVVVTWLCGPPPIRWLDPGARLAR
jgi:predicted 2-oxoglutarate/Fe(II)-dependent dioxygenase YbiX